MKFMQLSACGRFDTIHDSGLTELYVIFTCMKKKNELKNLGFFFVSLAPAVNPCYIVILKGSRIISTDFKRISEGEEPTNIPIVQSNIPRQFVSTVSKQPPMCLDHHRYFKTLQIVQQ